MLPTCGGGFVSWRMLDVRPLGLAGVCEIRPPRHGDARGFFSEVWKAEAMAAVGLAFDFVQDNHSYSAARGVLRGLHYQLPPAAQAKLVRASRGAIFDVVVDIRAARPRLGNGRACCSRLTCGTSCSCRRASPMAS